MKIVSNASYFGSGSSAIIDYLSEFNNTKNLTNFEFRFIHDPDGIRELEFNIVENFNRHNSGHAIKRYKRLVDYNSKHLFALRYEQFFNNQWKKISYEYIDSLVDFKYPGFWNYDFYDKGAFYEFFHKFPDRLLHATIWRKKPDNHLFYIKSTTYNSCMNHERFVELTRNYTRKLFEVANKENKEVLLLDQLVPSTNISRHMEYFDDIKVFIVDRDPRDVFLLAKYVWHDKVPPTDVVLFCKWFKYCRSTQTEEIKNKNIMLIQFEDLIYRYDEMSFKINNWLGFDENSHVDKFKYFDPSISIKNTRLWDKMPEHNDEIKYIEDNLADYLYDYTFLD